MTELRTIIKNSVLPQNIKNSITTFFSTPVQPTKIEKKNAKEREIRFSIHPPSDYFETLKNPNSNCQNEVQSKFRPSESEYAVCPWKQVKKKERPAQDVPKDRTNHVLQTPILQIKPVQIKANLVAPELPKQEDLEQQAPTENKPETTPPPESNSKALQRQQSTAPIMTQPGGQPKLSFVAQNQAGGQQQSNSVAQNQVGEQQQSNSVAQNQASGQPQSLPIHSKTQFSFGGQKPGGVPTQFSFGGQKPGGVPTQFSFGGQKPGGVSTQFSFGTNNQTG